MSSDGNIDGIASSDIPVSGDIVDDEVIIVNGQENSVTKESFGDSRQIEGIEKVDTPIAKRLIKHHKYKKLYHSLKMKAEELLDTEETKFQQQSNTLNNTEMMSSTKEVQQQEELLQQQELLKNTKKLEEELLNKKKLLLK